MKGPPLPPPVAGAPGIAALALPVVAGPMTVILPAGTLDAPDGAMMGEGPWHLDDAGGAALVAKVQARGRDLPIDYEHQTLLAAKNGQPAPAAGWIAASEIAWTPGLGVTAPIRWTDRAAAHIGAGEYRFLSPVFRYAPDGLVTDLLHVALTNTPALPTLPEVRLAAASRFPLEAPMPDNAFQKQVAKALSLAEDAPEADVLAALSRVLTEKDGKIAALTAQVQTAIPADIVNELRGELAALTAERETRKRSELLTAALSDGRLIQGTPLHAHAASLPIDAMEGLLKSLTPIAALGRTQTGGKTPETPAAPAAPVIDYEAIYAARRVKK